jgi:hypothetical protein
MLVHGNNLRHKETHLTKYIDLTSKQYLKEIRVAYDKWHHANLALIGPLEKPSPQDNDTVTQRVKLLEEYKDFLDQQLYAEKFDSRSNLHSSVLEEFIYYLFKDLVASFGDHALIGKSRTFKDVFFAPPSYTEMLKRPYAMVEPKDHDFVIGTTVEASFRSRTPPDRNPDPGGQKDLITEEPSNYNVVAVTKDAETHLFDIPAVAIECKTYLDKSMFEGSSRAAEELKARNPNALYIVVMEWIKLAESANPRKYKVDQLFVLRRQKNTDREFRYASDYEKNPIYPDVVFHLFCMVRNHLTTDWEGGVENGITRGWLI